MNGGLAGDDDIEIDDDKYANPETEVLWYMARKNIYFQSIFTKTLIFTKTYQISKVNSRN